MAILGLVLLGLLLVAFIMIGGRWLRRIARERPPEREWPRRPRPGDEPPEGFVDPEQTPSEPIDISSETSMPRESSDTFTDLPREDTRAD